MEELPKRKKHLETFLNSHALLEDGQYLPQKPSREANSNINTPGLRSTYGQANNLASCKVETKATKKMRYKMR